MSLGADVAIEHGTPPAAADSEADEHDIVTNDNKHDDDSSSSSSSSSTTSASISCRDLETSIQAMQSSNGICGHPQHYHSFQQVNFSFFTSTTKCVGCQGRMQSVVLFGKSGGGGGDIHDGPRSRRANDSVVKCLACGAVAHRSCALTTGSRKWTGPVCPVNAKHLLLQKQEAEEAATATKNEPAENNNNNISLNMSMDSDDNEMMALYSPFVPSDREEDDPVLLAATTTTTTTAPETGEGSSSSTSSTTAQQSPSSASASP